MRIKENRIKNRAVKRIKISALLFLASCLCSLSAAAQCAMCRASLESEGDKTKAQAVNDGIVFLMAVPYIIVGLIAYAIYRMYFKKKTA